MLHISRYLRLLNGHCKIDMAESRFSHLQTERLQYQPPLPRVLAGEYKATQGEVIKPATDVDALAKLFPSTFGKPLVHIESVNGQAQVRAITLAESTRTPRCNVSTMSQPWSDGAPLVFRLELQSTKAPLRLGCVLSGGQAPGGHNIISGLYDSIKRHHADSILYGFLDGPKGLMTGKYTILDDALMNNYRYVQRSGMIS